MDFSGTLKFSNIALAVATAAFIGLGYLIGKVI